MTQLAGTRVAHGSMVSRPSPRWVPLVPGLVTFLVMLWGITGPSYWRDETATISATDRPLPGLVRMLGHVDAVHGLYYLLMWVVSRVAGTSELAFRLPSALAMALAAAGIAAIGQRVRPGGAGLFAGLVFACIPVLSVWGQNARPYALEMAAAVLASLQFLRVLDSPGRRRLWLYGAALALLGYLNLFGLLLVPAHAITVAGTGKHRLMRGWVTTVVSGCLAVTPVAVYGWRERGQIAWIPAPGMSDVQDLVAVLGGGFVLSAVIIAALAGLGSASADWPSRQRADGSLTWLCLPWLLVPPVILLVASWWIHVYGPTYVLYCAPPVALLAGAGLAALWPPWRAAVLGLIVLVVLPAQIEAREADSHGDDIRAAATFLDRHARTGQAVLYTGGGTWGVPDWELGYPYGFSKLADIGEQESPAAANDLFGRAVTANALTRRLLEVHQLWVVEVGRADPMPSIITSRRFHLAGKWQFTDVWLRLYEVGRSLRRRHDRWWPPVCAGNDGRMDQAEWDARYAATDLMWSAGPNTFVAAELGELPAARALDLAAGEGRNAIWLASRGWTVSAVDFSAVALDRGAKLAARAGVTVDWVRADLLEYQPPQHAFDLVLIAYLQIEPASLRRVLASAVGALAPGGTLFIVGHDRDNLTRGYGGPQDADRLYTTELLTSALDGLTILTAGQVNRPVTTPDGERIAIDTLVRASLPTSPVVHP